jgi:GDSL-like Lipase/Acylhydrolase family
VRVKSAAVVGLTFLSLIAGCSGSTRETARPSASPARPTVPPHGYAALGDSYSAGDGAGAYFPDTDVAGNRCLRSRQAYGPLLDADASLGSLTFVACSGATTSDLVSPNHQRNVDAGSGQVEAAQISAIPVHTKTITLTIGGNDAGFSSVLASCIRAKIGPITVFPHVLQSSKDGCHNNASITGAVSARLRALAGQSGTSTASRTPIVAVTKLLAGIHARAPQAHVYLLGYPALFGTFSGSCHIGSVNVKRVPLFGNVRVAISITAADARWLNTMAGQLNDVLKKSVTAARVPATFVDVTSRFAGHRLCDSATSWIASVSGTADAKAHTAQLTPDVFHPTAAGQLHGYEAALISSGVS